MEQTDYDNSISELENIIGHNFKNKDVIFAAITHSSFANEKKAKKLKYNERLEFLGDSVLGLIISEYLFQKRPNLPEGELSVTRAKIVCENSLSQCATDISLGKYLLLGKGEELSGGREKISLLSDAFEALIGALYIDGGFETAKVFVYKYMDKIIKSCIEGKLFYDYKTQLQELVQQNGEQQISYIVTDQFGPDHNKTFITEVKINGAIQGQGKGHSKKEAEQNAAKDALNNLKTQ
ncbi:ribonuclease III [Ruminiclostridium papyrosolvens]|uniref:Ribonuclease 3 n=1 Tax=Ruminiclostridium papyrosolvens C7 TaxID=1330534 RepID=U4R305_9FIRM|nr:ribonuclease III [Ruminiclostridium papyrosolvens]EPR12830.1 ribonuclease III [Ruminiclostridium papyrosolvens C7]